MSEQTGSDHPTLYEYAGGRDAIWRLADVQYGRCLTDPVLIEVFGGEHLYTERHGGHGALLAHHANLRIQEHQRTRFVEIFLEAADAVGLPADERFRQRLHDYLQWGSKIAKDVSQPGADTTSDQPVPVWGWGPEGPP